MTAAESSSVRRRRDAFTLLELMVTVVLLVIVSGTGILAVQGPLARATMDRAITQIVAADAAERSASRRSPDPGRLLQVDVDRLRYTRSRRVLTLPRGVTVSRLWVLDPAATVREVGELSFATTAQTLSYGIELSGPRGHRDQVLILGISGQAIHDRDGSIARSLLQGLGSPSA